MSKMYGKGKNAVESEEQVRLRFQVELEFVQCLANPNYLTFLAQRGYFKDPTFINYLKYLQYWKEPEYVKFIMYPLALYFLDMLQYEHFRREIVSSQCCKFIDDQIILMWQHYAKKRTEIQNPTLNAANNTEAEKEQQQTQPEEQLQSANTNPPSDDKSGITAAGANQLQQTENSGVASTATATATTKS